MDDYRCLMKLHNAGKMIREAATYNREVLGIDPRYSTVRETIHRLQHLIGMVNCTLSDKEQRSELYRPGLLSKLEKELTELGAATTHSLARVLLEIEKKYETKREGGFDGL